MEDHQPVMQEALHSAELSESALEESLLESPRRPSVSWTRALFALGAGLVLVGTALVGMDGRQSGQRSGRNGDLNAFMVNDLIEAAAKPVADEAAQTSKAEESDDESDDAGSAKISDEAKAKSEDGSDGAGSAKKSKAKEKAAAPKDKLPSKADLEKAAKDADILAKKAKDLKTESDTLKGDAKDLATKAEGLQQDKEEAEKTKQKDKENAENDRNEAEELRKKVEDLKKKAAQDEADMKKKAAELDATAKDLDKDAVKQKSLAAAKLKAEEATKKKVDATKEKAAADEKDAQTQEEASLDAIRRGRVCIHLAGVRLKGDNPATFSPILGEHNITDEWQCTDWCHAHSECKQAVFAWETKTCELFKEASDVPISFRERWPWHNSTYCGEFGEKENMLAMLKKVYDAKPYVPVPHNCSWAGDNCLHTGCCADVCKPTWDFTECSWYTCWKRDDNWGGCELDGAPEDWEGTKLGGHPNTEIAPAEEGKLIQGTKLFCFSVVMWDAAPAEGWQDSEGTIANHWKEAGKNILQCDDYAFLEGLGGGSVHNIQSFIGAWKQVLDDGRWKKNDWVIKVDPDAVFFPEHFKSKVLYNWRTPQGAAVYLRNTFYKFKFLGALEALTREAFEIYAETSWKCEAHLGQEGGEDYWMEQCLEGLGIDYQTDESLLHDKYAADDSCDDPNGVAYHFFKKIEGGDGWDNCWNSASDAWNNAHPE